jgi:hypothetical protein
VDFEESIFISDSDCTDQLRSWISTSRKLTAPWKSRYICSLPQSAFRTNTFEHASYRTHRNHPEYPEQLAIFDQMCLRTVRKGLYQKARGPLRNIASVFDRSFANRATYLVFSKCHTAPIPVLKSRIDSKTDDSVSPSRDIPVLPANCLFRVSRSYHAVPGGVNIGFSSQLSVFAA